MKLLYISGKYTANSIWETQENIRIAEKYLIKYLNLGYAVHCPHKNTAMLDGIVGIDTSMNNDLEILKRCDCIVMLPDWKESKGANIEHSLAQDMHKEIIYE